MARKPRWREDRLVRTALVVDDHPGFRSYARVFLESSGFGVVGEARDGAGALEQTARLRPDLVLLDVHLPDIDGFEVARRLAQGVRPPAVILVSARDPLDFGPRLPSPWARGFVPKSRLSRAALDALL